MVIEMGGKFILGPRECNQLACLVKTRSIYYLSLHFVTVVDRIKSAE